MTNELHLFHIKAGQSVFHGTRVSVKYVLQQIDLVQQQLKVPSPEGSVTSMTSHIPFGEICRNLEILAI